MKNKGERWKKPLKTYGHGRKKHVKRPHKHLRRHEPDPAECCQGGAAFPLHAGTEETAPAEPSRPWLPDDERRLSLYIEKEERLQACIATLAACTTARQVGEAVARMCADEPKITAELIAKESFIRLLLPFLTGVGKGKGIDNLRLNINDAWAAYRKNRQKKVL